ncbi:hypothetical protein SAMN05216403_10560 [Nitrosospira multiformis ATCC 25196]|uniref:UPF0276 protein Nmul_A2550 n=2 Tax=Nitrosospira multiformis (strain ATCC 25196 / NCIMB 11849 / C 71) TaxID=323848 RepID=Y2550_NITMU|nr:DUF692 domain-containing protein [Nitrosospira multiformis]Q2Y5Y2.1 RecName: Full=UPF0276 protein Nmul_A2550 [Nitrosospira multiformis ATCC 25196]ABB75839.1 Protein of unknown function DUF692 [Nitrosospira multiformis ATCC 25196]SEF65283.1 hypothetical protein SAMN05216403_10560 [Nitrosospira multiformis ATCC 25196]
MQQFPRLARVGLGFRRELIPALKSGVPATIDFFEIAPENWIDLGGGAARDLLFFTERYPFVCHGLSLSIGGPAPLDEILLQKIRQFLDQHRVLLYTEHLSYCSDDGHLYDLLPIPFTEEAVKYVAERVRRTQDILERRIALENASFYVASPISDMSELDFIRAVLLEADCDLHLDVNNVYVNSINHDYDPVDFIRALPSDRIVYMHMAGHHKEAENLIIDTHGADVIDPVWSLLDQTYGMHGVAPTLLERDFNIPPLEQLMREVLHIALIQAQHADSGDASAT